MNTNTNNMNTNNDVMAFKGQVKITFETTGLDFVETRTSKGATEDSFNGVDDCARESERVKKAHLEPTKSSVTIDSDGEYTGLGHIIVAIGQAFGQLPIR